MKHLLAHFDHFAGDTDSAMHSSLSFSHALDGEGVPDDSYLLPIQ